MIARELANKKAHAAYGSRPFSDGAPARFVQDRWIWRDRQGCGLGDMEATVILTGDGSAQSVDVILLVNAALF